MYDGLDQHVSVVCEMWRKWDSKTCPLCLQNLSTVSPKPAYCLQNLSTVTRKPVHCVSKNLLWDLCPNSFGVRIAPGFTLSLNISAVVQLFCTWAPGFLRELQSVVFLFRVVFVLLSCSTCSNKQIKVLFPCWHRTLCCVLLEPTLSWQQIHNN